MAKIIAKSRYDERDVHGVDCSKDQIITKQSDKDSCDLNLIVRKYQTTGQLPSMIKQNPQYGDFSQVPTYMEAMEIVQKAQVQFDALDPRVRAKFENNPVKFLQFATDQKNMKEMVEMGLAIEREPENTASSSVVSTQATQNTPEVSQGRL